MSSCHKHIGVIAALGTELSLAVAEAGAGIVSLVLAADLNNSNKLFDCTNFILLHTFWKLHFIYIMVHSVSNQCTNGSASSVTTEIPSSWVVLNQF